MTDTDILSRINELIAEEHRLRDRAPSERTGPGADQARLRELEDSLDQCWDLLRRRRAARKAGRNPEVTDVRDRTEVERYLQ